MTLYWFIVGVPIVFAVLALCNVDWGKRGGL
jgi:hypothetical protein